MSRRTWPIAERADDMSRGERAEFARLVRALPEPVGPFLVAGVDREPVLVSGDPYARPRHRWWRFGR